MQGHFRLLSLASLMALLGSAGYGATVTGTVKGADGAPFQGAFVEAQNTKSHITTIVLSDSHGQYRIPDLPACNCASWVFAPIRGRE
jgi:hypothetical protein